MEVVDGDRKIVGGIEGQRVNISFGQNLATGQIRSDAGFERGDGLRGRFCGGEGKEEKEQGGDGQMHSRKYC